MIENYTFFAKWRISDVKFLNQFQTSREVVEGYCSFYVEKTEYLKIMEHFSKKDTLLKKTKPSEFSVIPSFTEFSKEELETASYYSTNLAKGKLHGFWDDGNAWQEILYQDVCKTCFLPKGEQQNPWVLKRDYKKNSFEFLGFEGLPGYVFCHKELAKLVKKEFGIDSMPVLIGKTKKTSEHLVQLKIPLSPYSLKLHGTPYGYTMKKGDEGTATEGVECCNGCGVPSYNIQNLDFFPPFETEFDFDLVLTQEWFGWYRRTIVSRRFLDFCFKHSLLKKWQVLDSRYIPQIKSEL